MFSVVLFVRKDLQNHPCLFLSLFINVFNEHLVLHKIFPLLVPRLYSLFPPLTSTRTTNYETTPKELSENVKTTWPRGRRHTKIKIPDPCMSKQGSHREVDGLEKRMYVSFGGIGSWVDQSTSVLSGRGNTNPPCSRPTLNKTSKGLLSPTPTQTRTLGPKVWKGTDYIRWRDRSKGMKEWSKTDPEKNLFCERVLKDTVPDEDPWVGSYLSLSTRLNVKIFHGTKDPFLSVIQIIPDRRIHTPLPPNEILSRLPRSSSPL